MKNNGGSVKRSISNLLLSPA